MWKLVQALEVPPKAGRLQQEPLELLLHDVAADLDGKGSCFKTCHFVE